MGLISYHDYGRLCFIQNGASAFLAAQIEDVAELGVHSVALGIRQGQPRGKKSPCCVADMAAKSNSPTMGLP